MTHYELFRKNGARYASAPFRTITTPSIVFASLANVLMAKYLHHSDGIERITRRRCPYCDSFDEVSVIHRFPNGERIKAVYTIPIV